MTLDVLQTDDVASLLGCAPETVRERACLGKLPGLKFGKDWVFPAAALHQRLTEMAIEESAQLRKPAPRSAVLHAITKKPKRTPPVLPGV